MEKYQETGHYRRGEIWKRDIIDTEKYEETALQKWKNMRKQCYRQKNMRKRGIIDIEK